MLASDQRAEAVRRVLIVTLLLNLLVAAAKVVAGMSFHVLSLSADGLHSSLDGLNNVVGLVALNLAHRPPDAGHPYGHRKFETFAALGIGVSLGLVGAGLARGAMARLHSAAMPEHSAWTFGIALFTLLVNFAISKYEARRGRELQSEFLVADAAHTRSDMWVTVAVIGALVGVWWHLWWIDLLAAITIAGFIGYTAFQIIRQNLNVLADAAAVSPEQVGQLVNSVAGVKAVHRVRSRGAGGHIFVDLHVQVEPAMPTAASHHLGHQVADVLKAQIPGVADVLVHIEPYPGTDEDCD